MCDIFLTLLLHGKVSLSHKHRKSNGYIVFIKVCIPKFVKDALKPPEKKGIHVIFFLFLHKYFVGTQKCLLLMSISHNGCFHREIRKMLVLFG